MTVQEIWKMTCRGQKIIVRDWDMNMLFNGVHEELPEGLFDKIIFIVTTSEVYTDTIVICLECGEV